MFVGRRAPCLVRHGLFELLEFLHAVGQELFGVDQCPVHVDAGIDVLLVLLSRLFHTRHIFLVEIFRRLDQGQERVENVGVVVLIVLVLLIHDFFKSSTNKY